MKTVRQFLCYLCNRQVPIIFVFVFFLSFKTSALNYFWVGGTGIWSDLSHWATTSGGTTLHIQIPTALDDVFFDANSFTAGGQTITLDPTTALAHNFTWTAVANTPTMAGPSINLLKLYGSLTLASGMNITFAGNVDFEATTAGETVTMNGNSFHQDVSFNGIGGEWTLQDNFRTDQLIYLLRGTLNTNDKAVNAAAFYSYNYGVQRTLNMGASVFTLTNSGNMGFGNGLSDFWRVADPGAGLTINCGTSIINSTGSFLHTEFQSEGFTYYDVNFQGSGANMIDEKIFGGPNNFHDVSFGGFADLQYAATFHDVTFHDDASIANSNTYNNLNLSAGHTYEFYEGKTQTINGAINANGNCGALINISSFNAGNQATFSHASGPINVSFIILKDIIATGGGNFTANSSVDLGNNTGWTINSAPIQNLYWIGGSGNWDDGNHWSLTSGGTASGCSPTPLDNVFFDVNSFSSPSQTVTINVFTTYCRDMTWTGVTNTPTLAGAIDHLLKIYGSLVFATGMNITFLGDVSFEATTVGKTITMNGKSFRKDATFNGLGGAWTLQDNFSTDQLIYLLRGTLNTNDKAVNAAAFYSYNYGAQRTLNMGGSVFTLTNSGNMGFGNGLSDFWRVADPGAGLTINCGTSTINSTGSFLHTEFQSEGFTYYDVNFQGSGPNIIDQRIFGDPNTFHDVSFNAFADLQYSATYHDETFNDDANIANDNTYHNLNLSAGHTYKFLENKIQTVNGSINANGNCGALINISSFDAGSQATFSHAGGLINVSFVILKILLQQELEFLLQIVPLILVIIQGGQLFHLHHKVYTGLETMVIGMMVITGH